jgi:hypothetical protein
VAFGGGAALLERVEEAKEREKPAKVSSGQRDA